jgi:hypothetical protein
MTEILIKYNQKPPKGFYNFREVKIILELLRFVLSTIFTKLQTLNGINKIGVY